MPIPLPEERIATMLAEKYRLDAIIGSGGAGVLYKATHTWTGREVAVKMLHFQHSTRESQVGRLLAEARVAARLKHPHVVEVLDAGMEGGSPFIVLELLSGHSLAEELRQRKRIVPELLLEWLLPIMGAVAVAHDHGILHRDLKLENIFLVRSGRSSRSAKLLDFGLARPVDNDSFLTDTGTTVGTPAFMAPEQARAVRNLTPAVDVWGLGVVFFLALSGRLPFVADSSTEMLVQIVSNAAPRLQNVAPDVPTNLAHAIDRALQRNMSLRYENMRAFARALVAAAQLDRLALPEDPDPLGLPDWSEWLRRSLEEGPTQSLELASPPVENPPPDLLTSAPQLSSPALWSISNSALRSGRTRRVASIAFMVLLGGVLLTAGLLWQSSRGVRAPAVQSAGPLLDAARSEMVPAPVVSEAPTVAPVPEVTPDAGAVPAPSSSHSASVPPQLIPKRPKPPAVSVKDTPPKDASTPEPLRVLSAPDVRR